MKTVIAVLVVVCGSPVFGWSTKEHVQLARIAAEELIAEPATPEGMKAWLRSAVPQPMTMEQEREYLLHAHQGIFPRGVDGIPYFATVPDLLTFSDPPEKKTEPFGVHERLLHYIDLEYFHDDEAKRNYADDLSGKPAEGEIPRDMSDPRYQRAGMLPFRVEYCYKELVRTLKAGRLVDRPGEFPRDDHAAKWAGFLAHYVGDNTQPQHATIDYKSAAYFPHERNGPNVHAQVEYVPVDDEGADYPELREEYWAALAGALKEVRDTADVSDVWAASVRLSLESYDVLPLIGRSAAAASMSDKGRVTVDTVKFYHGRGLVNGVEMSVLEAKAHQQAMAVRRTQRLWVQAWREAGR